MYESQNMKFIICHQAMIINPFLCKFSKCSQMFTISECK